MTANNPFKAWGIERLSPSALNTFEANPAIFVLRYGLGVKDYAGAKAWVGNAVEAGLYASLRGQTMPEAQDIAAMEFRKLAEEAGKDPNDEVEAKQLLRAMLCQAVDNWPYKIPVEAYQTELRYQHPDLPVPFYGFSDFFLADGTVVDLKTTSRMPSSPPLGHICQLAIYAAAHKASKASLFYVGKSKVMLAEVGQESLTEGMRRLVQTAFRIGRMIDAFPNPVDALQTMPTIPDDFRWSEALRHAYLKNTGTLV